MYEEILRDVYKQWVEEFDHEAAFRRHARRERRDMIVSAWPSSSSPARVSRTGREPPGLSKSRWPTYRSSAAICWLIADCA